MELAQHFQQLALLLIQTTKILQIYANAPPSTAHGPQGISSDKDLEQKFKVMKEILEFGFKIPANIYKSILLTLLQILTSRLDLAKDFLVIKLLSILETLFDAQNSGELINENLDALTDYIKWALTLVKEKNTQPSQEEYQETSVGE